MRSFRARSAPRRRTCVALGFALSTLCCFVTGPSYATDPLAVVRIEEDWELVVMTPETSSNSPQVTCAMSPAGGDDSDYMTFELNHQSQPGYATGGLHLHAWDSDFLLGSSHGSPSVSMHETEETVRWTQAMTLNDGMLTYEILDGTSDTWGSFGSGELRVSVATSLSNLNGYDIENSLNGSGVGFGANRVSSFVLRSVRLVTSSGETVEVPINHDVLSEQ